ncbi:MAG TPA: nuclear transport factor 2 family protein [Candidatus Sulfotelmatobacter sp.]|jgi:hypothetical protein
MVRNVCFSFLLVFAAAPFRGQEADDPDVKSKIVALERLSKVQAWKAKDIKTLDKLLDDNYQLVNSEGKLQNKSDVLALVQSSEVLDYIADSIVVRTHHDTAIATGRYQIRGLRHGKVFSERGRFLDTWLLKAGQWVTIATLATPTG